MHLKMLVFWGEISTANRKIGPNLNLLFKWHPIRQNSKKANLDFNKVIFMEQVDKFKKAMVEVIMYFIADFIFHIADV